MGHLPSALLAFIHPAKELRRPDLSEAVEQALVLADDMTALYRLRCVGASISVDDLGTERSSLALRIDKSFVGGLGRDAGNTALVRLIVELAHAFGMETIAEGVKTEQQVALLGNKGRDMTRGYLFSQPLAAKGAASLPNAVYRRNPPVGW